MKQKYLLLNFCLVLGLMCYISDISVFGQATLTHSYTFEDGTADDFTGTADGTLNGTSYTISDGVYSSVADGDYISFSGVDLALNTYTSGITIEAYVRAGNATNPGWSMFAYFGGASGDNAYILSIARNDDVSRTEYVGGAYVNGLELEDGDLHHLVSILTDTTIKYYIDGMLIGKAIHTKPVSDINTDNALLCKGGWPDPSWLGSIYEFNIYSGIMDETTISNNASAFLNSSDARLSDLTVDAGTLTPDFDPLTTHYAIEIPTGTTTVNITPTAMVVAASVTGGGAVDVSGGSKTDTIKVTSTDGTTTKIYTVDIKLEDATCFVPLYNDKTNIVTDPELTDLSNFAGWGTKNLVYGLDAYCGITAIKVAGNCGGSLDFDLDATGAILPNTSYRMKAMVYVGGSGKFKLGFFGTGMPSEIVTSTQLDTWESLEMVFTTGTTLGTDYGMYFNSCEGNNGEVGYIDNWELYQVSDDATLSALSVSTGSLVPDFNSDVVSYSVVVPSATASVDITATVNDPKAIVAGDGTFALSGGEGIAEVVVTAESGSTKTYTIIFSSTLSSDATLSDLNIDVNHLISPVFDPATEDYDVVIATGTDTVIITATPNHAAAEAEYNDTVDVRSGSETVDIVVTAEDGTIKTYTLNIAYEQTDCYVPLFSDGRTNYIPDPYLNSLTGVGGWGAKSIVIGEDAYCGLSAVKLTDNDGSGCTAALDISNFAWKANTAYRVRAMVKTVGGSIGILASGTNPNFGFAFDSEGEWVELDTTFKTGASPSVGFFSFNTCDYSSNCTAAYIDNYELYEVSSDATLSALSVNLGSLTPDFSPGTYTYSVVVPSATASVDITATVNDPNASVTGDGAFALSNGEGVAEVVVTAESGEEKTYTITFSSTMSSDATLTTIDIDVNYLISPAFDPETEDYDIVIAAGTDTVIITATPNHAAAETEYNDTVDVRSGSETVDIVVSAEDGTQKTYTLNIAYEQTDCFVPLFSDERTNYVPDSYLNSLTGIGGWGAKTIVIGEEAYCGLSAAKLTDDDGSGCTAALDISDFEWKANTAYRMRVMVKTIGGTIGILANGTDPNFGFAFDSEGEWVELDTIFMTGASPSVGFFSFNTCDFSSNCTAAYIDNYELYEVSSDASLTNLLVSGSTVNGFDAATYSYDVDLAAGTTDVPVVTATTASEYAEAVVTAATGLPGSTTVTVTAEDGVTEAVYTINFTVIPTSDLTDIEQGLIKIYPTVSGGNFTVITNSKSSMIKVYDMKGTLVLEQRGESFEQTLLLPKEGMYIVKVECDNASGIFKLFSTKK